MGNGVHDCLECIHPCSYLSPTGAQGLEDREGLKATTSKVANSSLPAWGANHVIKRGHPLPEGDAHRRQEESGKL